MRDDFLKSTIETLSKRANNSCSSPTCRRPTSGPHSDPYQSINIGIAAHISAASPGGKRYNRNLTPEERKSINNAIWLCQSCSKLIDTDEDRFPEELLHTWKKSHEEAIFKSLYSINSKKETSDNSLIMNKVNIIPNGKNDSVISFITITNSGISNLVITSLLLRVNEFLYKIPCGNAHSSSIGEYDLGEITKYGKSDEIPMFRIVEPGQTDEFSIVLSAGSKSGIFCAWNLALALKTNMNNIDLGEKEVLIPSPETESGNFFEEFKSEFVQLYRSNNEGLNLFQRFITFRRHWFSKGFTFTYSFLLFYSGPINFIKNR